jgi:Ca2+-binding RTX toxin-like protein
MIAGAAVLGLPAVAAAGVATSEGFAVRYSDPAGAADRLSAGLDGEAGSGWRVTFFQFPATTPGPGCEEGFTSTDCRFPAVQPWSIAVDAGGGDDVVDFVVTAEAQEATAPITVAGGPGDDRISTVRTRAELDGGDGDDVLMPDERVALDVPPGPTPGGVIRGGAGVDTVDYANALDPISVSLDGTADDGRDGEGDDVRPDVENIVGSHFGGTLTGSAAANDIAGGGGDDLIAGGAGRDTLAGTGGNDRIDALDGAGGDRVLCSDGVDVAFADASDIVADEACEKLAWAPAIRGARLRLRGGRIAIALTCPKAASRCRGTLLLRSKRSATLARASYRMRPGKRVTLRLRPTRAGRAALRGRAVQATAFVQPAGAKALSGRAVTVRR